MKQIKIPDDFFKTSILSQIVLPIADRMKALHGLKIAFHKCIVLSLATGKPLIDPFQLYSTLKGTQIDATTELPSAGRIYESLRQWAAAESTTAATAFEPTLRAFCTKHAYKIDGRYPAYLVDGFLSVRVRDTERETEIGTHSVPSLLVDTIAPMIKELIAEERARKFDGGQFLETVYQAYERCLLLQKASPGDPMAVRKVYQELVMVRQADAFLKSAKRALFSEYTAEFFARDLMKLLQGSPCQTKSGKWLAVTPTSFAADGVPIWQNGQARIIGRLAFSTDHP